MNSAAGSGGGMRGGGESGGVGSSAEASSAGQAEGRSGSRGPARVGIVYGSPSDIEIVKAAESVLDRFGVAYESHLLSAHRMPDATARFAREARSRGLRVIVAMAGLAAHLGGVVAAHTTLPVLGVPVSGGVSGGLDALLSMVQMPAGVPVGTLALDKHGARNAAVLAVSILALSDESLAARLEELKNEMAAGGRL